MRTRLARLLLLCPTLLLASACESKHGGGNAGAAASATDTSSGTASSTATGAAEKDYAKDFCEQFKNLKLRADVGPEIGYFCQNGAPTDTLRAYRTKALEAVSGQVKVETLVDKHGDDQQQEFVLAWAFRAMIRPVEIKDRPLYENFAKGITSDTIVLKSQATRAPDSALDGGLHILSADLSYDLHIKGPNGLDLHNTRNTQYNVYQVQATNDELGFGEEHLTDTANPDYTRSTMINVSFNDGTSANDGKGGSINVALLHIIFNNRNYPATATNAITEIANYLSAAMYDALKK